MLTANQKDLVIRILGKEFGKHKGKLLQLNRLLELNKKQLGINTTHEDISHKEMLIENEVVKIDNLLQTIEAVKSL